MNCIDISFLKTMIAANGLLRLTICGNSMFPTLKDGDQIDIIMQKEYCIGDVLVFASKNNTIVAHRLLKINNKLYCKGDNSFLLEHVDVENVLGRVKGFKRGSRYFLPIAFDNEMVLMSYRIAKAFRMCGYDKKKILQNPLYTEYLKKLTVLCSAQKGD